MRKFKLINYQILPPLKDFCKVCRFIILPCQMGICKTCFNKDLEPNVKRCKQCRSIMNKDKDLFCDHKCKEKNELDRLKELKRQNRIKKNIELNKQISIFT